MATLSDLLKEKLTIDLEETNLETGQVFSFTPGTSVTGATEHFLFCWEAPGSGEAVIEVWGAGGSAGANCCCSMGLPGNPGAYSKRTIPVDASSFVCGKMGGACNNADCCYPGRSECSCICYSGTTLQGNMIAEGGRGGPTMNSNNGTAPSCCYRAEGYPFTQFQDYCGIVCNYVEGEIAQASGGDINCAAGWSCTIFKHCNSCCACRFEPSIRTSPGIYHADGAIITYTMDKETESNTGGGNGQHHMYAALSSASRTPAGTGMKTYCWNSGRFCSCYGIQTCRQTLPFGIPAAPQYACPGTWDYGMMGGHGAVRITFR